jgi:hypothetical protein
MLETPETLGARGVGRGLGPIPRRSRLAEVLRIALASMALLAFGEAALRAANCDYYASPGGTGNGLSSSSPFRVSAFWKVATAGKTLCLMDGTYTGSAGMIVPPWGLNGASGLPITIRALNDGKVLITGQGSRNPVWLDYNDWFLIEGINACCAESTVLGIEHGNHNVIRRVAAWDAADGNTNIFGVHYGLYNLLEDVAGWGTARKIFSGSQGGDYTTIRRAWGRWERSTVVGPKMTYELAYNNHYLTCENCLGTWSGQGMPETYVLMDYFGQPWSGLGAGTFTNYTVQAPYGIFSAGIDDAKLLGSLAYVLPTDHYKPSTGIFLTGSTSMEVKDTASYIAPGLSVRPFLLWVPPTGLANNLSASDITSFGGASSSIHSSWEANNVWSGSSPASYSPGENIFNTTRGANLCNQYQDGNLTNQPLWPWPMNQRIKDALVQSGRAPVDITATIQGFFGTIPPACLAGGTMPATPSTPDTPEGPTPNPTQPPSPNPTQPPSPNPPQPPSPNPTQPPSPKPTPGPSPNPTTGSGALPYPWLDHDIGSPRLSGSAGYSAGIFTIRGSGADIWGTSDQFNYVYQPLSGDATIIARVASIQKTDVWAKTGVMIRASLASNSTFAMMIETPAKGLSFMRRRATGGMATHTPGAIVASPYWVKLTRRGNTFTGYSSPNGVTWKLVGSDTISMSSKVYIGLPLSAHSYTLVSTAKLGNVTLTRP